jgi:hypothetical protein
LANTKEEFKKNRLITLAHGVELGKYWVARSLTPVKTKKQFCARTGRQG